MACVIFVCMRYIIHRPVLFLVTAPKIPKLRYIFSILGETAMDLAEMGWGVMDWIGVAQDVDQWMVPVNVAMISRVPLNAGKFFLTAQLVATRIVLSSVDLVN
jgi:hypothetical protein